MIDARELRNALAGSGAVLELELDGALSAYAITSPPSGLRGVTPAAA